MSYLAVAYPKFKRKDYQWIQNYRKRFDLRFYNIVEPHITLVFALKMNREVFVRDMRSKLKKVKKINFELKIAALNFDNSQTYYHEFLIPEKGHSSIIKLHDKLYSGKLNKFLRLDIDYIPHIGIGNSDSGIKSKKRVDYLNKKAIAIKGTINYVDVIEYDNNQVKTIDRIKLV